MKFWRLWNALIHQFVTWRHSKHNGTMNTNWSFHELNRICTWFCIKLSVKLKWLSNRPNNDFFNSKKRQIDDTATNSSKWNWKKKTLNKFGQNMKIQFAMILFSLNLMTLLLCHQFHWARRNCGTSWLKYQRMNSYCLLKQRAINSGIQSRIWPFNSGVMQLTAF